MDDELVDNQIYYVNSFVVNRESDGKDCMVIEALGGDGDLVHVVVYTKDW